MRKNTISLWITFLFFSIGIGYTQSVDPRGAGEYMDYSTISMPESPSAKAFNAVSEIQVNPAKGVPHISIPLYTYELDGVQVPISLSYDASGIKVSQMSTAVGLGWSLVAGGQISRTVRSKPDEEYHYGWFQDGYIRQEYYDDKDPHDLSWQQIMKGTLLNNYKGLVSLRDHNPDIFSYSILGFSGSYIHTTDQRIVKELEDGLSIDPYGTDVDDLYAKDFFGNLYYFDKNDSEKSNDTLVFHDGQQNLEKFVWENANAQPIVTAWKLSQITTKNGKKINFNYVSETMNYIFPHNQNQLTVGKDCDNVGPTGSTRFINNIYWNSTQLLQGISSPHNNIEIEFEYDDDNGLPDSVWKKKLKKITILDVVTGNKREFHFEYSRFSGDPRLRLDEIWEMSHKNGVVEKKPPHVFVYQDGILPAKNSKGQDLYGYYNLNDNNNGLIPNTFNGLNHDEQQFYDLYSGNRALNINGLKRGVLTDITYPTGGTTTFEYEPNVEDLSTMVGYRGGLRVKQIINADSISTYFSIKTYQYNELHGEDFQADILRFFEKKEGNTRTFFASPIRLPGDWGGYKTGYFYGKVTMVSHGATTGENFKVEYKYKDNPYNIQSYEHVLESETVFQGTTANRLKVVEYEYDIISSTGDPEPEIVEWWVVGDMECFFFYPFNMALPHALGYTTSPRKIQFTGNYGYLPVRIATTEFPSGNASKRLTVLKNITYDPLTMLKKTEITDFRYKREENSSGTVSYTMSDSNAEVITMTYTYPFDVPDFASLPSFPQGTVIKQEVTTTKNGQTAQTGGRAYAFDSQGNIETVYSFEKGQGTNYSSLSYVPSHYQERTRFLFSDGHPVQVWPKDGIPTSYIWNLTANVPVAKIEGLSRAALNQNLVAQLEQADFAQLPSLLMQLRTTLPNPDKVFLTTYTYKPLAGVETITDPKGYKTTYEYDAFGRLQYVRDPDGNLLNETEYNYALD